MADPVASQFARDRILRRALIDEGHAIHYGVNATPLLVNARVLREYLNNGTGALSASDIGRVVQALSPSPNEYVDPEVPLQEQAQREREVQILAYQLQGCQREKQLAVNPPPTTTGPVLR